MKKRSVRTGFQGSRLLFCMGITLLLLPFCFLLSKQEAYAAPVKVVLDPGHGGDDMGSRYGVYTEKYMNMVVAKAMEEELKKYDGIEVFLTRTEDVPMSLQERADYAKSVDADFLFCLHFNATKEHNMYGSEVWCSAFGEYYKKGRCFGEMCLDELCSLGIYRRGVKMRLSEKDEEADYYGIIRHCVENDIPSCIIEHCYLDNREDESYHNTTESMQKLGVLDATAVAKYYGLSSEKLDVNYKNYPKTDIASLPKLDATEPEASLTLLRRKEEEGEVNVLLTGEDKESGILYYTYSLDGGKTYLGLQKWEEGKSELELTVKIPEGEDVKLRYRVYNGYDLYTDTEDISLSTGDTDTEDMPEDNPEKEDAAVGEMDGSDAESVEAMSEISGEVSGNNVHQIDMSRYERGDAGDKGILSVLKKTDFSGFFLLVILGFLVSLLVVLLILRGILNNKRRKTRYKGRRR